MGGGVKVSLRFAGSEIFVVQGSGVGMSRFPGLGSLVSGFGFLAFSCRGFQGARSEGDERL